MESVLDLFEEIIAVDSESTDGTLELLQMRIGNRPNATLLSHPPGLYSSWNHAIAEASREWIYFSTIGDILDGEAILKFFNAATQLKCDVLISPPLMLEADGQTTAGVRWPVHLIAEAHRSSEAKLLTREETILGFFSFLTGSLLGSSASNLYRSSFLKARPFPEDFGHAGDTAWGLRYGPEMNVGLYPESVASFTMSWEFRDRDARLQRDFFLRLCEEGRISLRRAVAAGMPFEFLAGWFEGLIKSKEILWNWLSDQAELASAHHSLVEEARKMEQELSRRWPERLLRAVQRRINSFNQDSKR